MRCFAMLVLGLLVSPLVAAEPKIDWVKIKNDNGRFEVQFPGKPVDNSKDKDKAPQFVLEAEAGKVAFLTMANVLPEAADITDKDVVKKMFEGGKDGLLKTFKGSKVVAERNVTFAGKYPSKEVDVDIPELGLYRTKWVVTETTFIQMVVLGPKDYVEGATSSLFMDSLKIASEAKKK